jgi:hypothetical protein
VGLVRPNVDTLYSMAAIDLSHSDVVLTIPPVDDSRFYVFPFYDLYVIFSTDKIIADCA